MCVLKVTTVRRLQDGSIYGPLIWAKRQGSGLPAAMNDETYSSGEASAKRAQFSSAAAPQARWAPSANRPLGNMLRAASRLRGVRLFDYIQGSSMMPCSSPSFSLIDGPCLGKIRVTLAGAWREKNPAPEPICQR
jgi:hypothetical protein